MNEHLSHCPPPSNFLNHRNLTFGSLLSPLDLPPLPPEPLADCLRSLPSLSEFVQSSSLHGHLRGPLFRVVCLHTHVLIARGFPSPSLHLSLSPFLPCPRLTCKLQHDSRPPRLYPSYTHILIARGFPLHLSISPFLPFFHVPGLQATARLQTSRPPDLQTSVPLSLHVPTLQRAPRALDVP